MEEREKEIAAEWQVGKMMREELKLKVTGSSPNSTPCECVNVIKSLNDNNS